MKYESGQKLVIVENPVNWHLVKPNEICIINSTDDDEEGYWVDDLEHPNNEKFVKECDVDIAKTKKINAK